MEQVAVLTAVVLLASKLVELAKFVRNKDWNGALTLAVLMVVGVAVVFFAAEAEVTETLVVPGTVTPIGVMDGPSLVFVGLIFTSLVSKLYDFQKALDGSDSAAQPSLFPDASDGPPKA